MAPHDHTITTALVLALILNAAAGAIAGRASAASGGRHSTAQRPSVQIVRVSPPDRFDWGDAGIGAAGGFGVSMLGVGAGLVISGMRNTNPREGK